MANASYTPPGRLGDPNMTLATDPRTHPKIRQLVQAFPIANATEHPKEWSIESLTPGVAASEAAVSGLYEMLENDLPTDADEPKVDISEQTIKGVDGNDIKVYIYKPASAQEPLPAVLYFHGGGMVILPTTSKVHRRWTHSLAAKGVISVLVDYRNAYTASGHHPFPAGLNDCAAVVQHIAAHKSELGISKIILQGESGGGNLSITTAMKANREGWVSQIDGVFATVPYISGAYAWPLERQLKELPSLVENNGYLIQVENSAALAYYYGPGDLENPLAWPYHASVEELKGLPPFILDMNELDPLRDEGLVFGQKLAAAGVHVESKVTSGIPHGAALVFRKMAPEFHNGAVRDIVAFARSL